MDDQKRQRLLEDQAKLTQQMNLLPELLLQRIGELVLDQARSDRALDLGRLREALRTQSQDPVQKALQRARAQAALNLVDEALGRPTNA